MIFNFEFLRLKKALPPRWINLLRNVNTQTKTSDECALTELATGDLINVNTTTSKQYYSLLAGEKKVLPSVIYYWEDVLKLDCEIDWEKVLQFKFGKIFDNRLKHFNFKVFHKIVPSKSNLHRWQILDDDMCQVCGEKETTSHVLLTCRESQTFWKIVKNLIYNLYRIEININEEIMITGYDIAKTEYRTINIMLNFAFYVIYKMYLQKIYENRKMYTRKLFIEYKSTLKAYFRCKLNQNYLNKTEVENVLLIL